MMLSYVLVIRKRVPREKKRLLKFCATKMSLVQVPIMSFKEFKAVHHRLLVLHEDYFGPRNHKPRVNEVFHDLAQQIFLFS